MNFKHLIFGVAATTVALTSAPALHAAESVDEKGYTLEMDFEIETISAGVIFAAQNQNTFYMWQINNDNPQNPMLRPHSWDNGKPALLGQIELLPLGVDINAKPVHKLRIEVEDARIATTYIDDIEVYTTEGNFEMGLLGFRQSFSNGVIETALYDNITVTKADGTQVFYTDFSKDGDFHYGELTDGRLRVPGVLDGDARSWSRNYMSDVHFKLEADMNLVKDDVSFIFSHLNDNDYYMWAINAFDYPEMCIRHHIFNNGNLVWNDSRFNQFSKEDILGTFHHIAFEVNGGMIVTTIDDIVVDKYIDYSTKLVPAAVGVRIDTRAQQQDDAYIDNIKTTVYAADGTSTVTLEETFEPGTPRWFPNVITEEIDGNTMMHIFGDKVLYKWVQADEPTIEIVPEGYVIDLDFEISSLNMGFCFAASNRDSYYMWQINNENPAAPMFRPHVWNNGNPVLIGEYPIPSEVNLTEEGKVHHLCINVSNYMHADTYIDDVLIDSRDGSFISGLIGFRQTHSDAAGTIEAAYFDNITITNIADNKIIYQEDFENGNEFSSGEIVDGRLYVAGRMDWDHFAWSPIPGNEVWYRFEADMELIKDDVAFVFSALDDDNYYMWAFNAFDDQNDPNCRIRRHVFSPGLWWNDHIIYYTKQNLLNGTHHVAIDVKGGFVRTYIDGQLFDDYFTTSNGLVLGKVGFRIDTKAEQNDDAYIDNVRVTKYDTDGTPSEVLYDDFEPSSPSWFPEAIVENVNGNHKLHIYGDNVLYKWMQADEPTPGKTDGIETIETDNGAVEYYNIQGMRISRPEKGFYIERQGSRVTKRFIK